MSETNERSQPTISPQNQSPSPSGKELTALFLEQPSTLSGEEPITPSRDQPITQSRDQPITQSRDQPITQARDQPITQSRDQPITQARDQPITESRDQPITQARNQPTTPSRKQPKKFDPKTAARFAQEAIQRMMAKERKSKKNKSSKLSVNQITSPKQSSQITNTIKPAYSDLASMRKSAQDCARMVNEQISLLNAEKAQWEASQVQVNSENTTETSETASEHQKIKKNFEYQLRNSAEKYETEITRLCESRDRFKRDLEVTEQYRKMSIRSLKESHEKLALSEKSAAVITQKFDESSKRASSQLSQSQEKLSQAEKKTQVLIQQAASEADKLKRSFEAKLAHASLTHEQKLSHAEQQIRTLNAKIKEKYPNLKKLITEKITRASDAKLREMRATDHSKMEDFKKASLLSCKVASQSRIKAEKRAEQSRIEAEKNERIFVECRKVMKNHLAVAEGKIEEIKQARDLEANRTKVSEDRLKHVERRLNEEQAKVVNMRLEFEAKVTEIRNKSSNQISFKEIVFFGVHIRPTVYLTAAVIVSTTIVAALIFGNKFN
eukprot:228483_1